MNIILALILTTSNIGFLKERSPTCINYFDKDYKEMRIKDFTTYLFGISSKGLSLANKQIKSLTYSDLAYLLREDYYTDVVIVIAVNRIKDSELKIHSFNHDEDSDNQRELIRELLIVSDYQWDINPLKHQELIELLDSQILVLKIPDYIKSHFKSYEPKEVVVDNGFIEEYEKLIDEDTASHVHSAFEKIRENSTSNSEPYPSFYRRKWSKTKNRKPNTMDSTFEIKFKIP